jgi:hypothetical protein
MLFQGVTRIVHHDHAHACTHLKGQQMLAWSLDYFYFDLRYVFKASSFDALMSQVEEIVSVRWQPFDALRDICPSVWRR